MDIEVAEKDQRSVPWGHSSTIGVKPPHQVSDGPSHRPSGYRPDKSRGGTRSAESE